MSTKHWANPGLGNYSQENNASENLVGHLESCGPTALACLLEDLDVEQIHIPHIQIEDYYTIVMNSPKLIESPDGYPANRYILNYKKLIEFLYPKLFVKNVWYPDPYTPSAAAQLIKMYLERKDTGLIAVMKNPGHYVSLNHFEAGVVYYSDPWVGNTYNPAPLVKRSIRLRDLAENLKIGFVAVTNPML